MPHEKGHVLKENEQPKYNQNTKVEQFGSAVKNTHS
jgi:hypothetical protein